MEVVTASFIIQNDLKGVSGMSACMDGVSTIYTAREIHIRKLFQKGRKKKLYDEDSSNAEFILFEFFSMNLSDRLRMVRKVIVSEN